MLPTKNILKKVSDINRRDQSTVFGFIRRIQRLIKNKHIPLVIEYICLLFFYETDRFYPESTIRYPDFAMLGMMDILDNAYSRKFLYQWRFKANKNKKRVHTLGESEVQLGITDVHRHFYTSSERTIKLTSNGNMCSYGPGQTLSETAIRKNVEKWNSSSTRILFNDEIIMSMDIEKKKMEYVIQRGTYVYCFPDISIEFPAPNQKYRMFVLHRGQDKEIEIKLTAFTKVPRTSDKTHNELIKDQIERIKCEEVKKSNRGIIKL